MRLEIYSIFYQIITIVRLIRIWRRNKVKMRLLIGGSPSKKFHLEEFLKDIERNGIK